MQEFPFETIFSFNHTVSIFSPFSLGEINEIQELVNRQTVAVHGYALKFALNRPAVFVYFSVLPSAFALFGKLIRRFTC